MQPSDKILLGLYRFLPALNDDLTFETAQLAWLLDHSADCWVGENGTRKLDYPPDKGPNKSYLERPIRDRANIKKQLSVLSAKRCVSFVPPKGFDFTFRIQLLSEGLLRAEKLNSFIGKIDLWYSDNKNGIIGLVVTIIVSVITSLVTTLLSK